MRLVILFVVVLVCSLLLSLASANEPAPAASQSQTPPPPTPTPTPAAPATASATAPQPSTPPTPPTPTPQTQSAPAPAAVSTASVPVAEHQHHKIESDLSHLNDLVSKNAEKIREISEDLHGIKVSVSGAVTAAALDALKLDVKSSLDSLSSKTATADHNAKLLAENAQSLRSSDEKLASFAAKIQQVEGKVQLLEKNAEKLAEDTKAQLERIKTSSDAAFHALKVEFNEKLAKVESAAAAAASAAAAAAAAAASSFDFSFDWDTISTTIVSKSKAAGEKAVQLSVQLYERAQKEFTTFRAESIPSREEAEKIVKEWWENAQQFYWTTAQPAAIDFYHTARHYFDDATEQLTDVLADKAGVPKETARLIALSFLALTAGVLAFVIFVILLQIVSFLLSIVFYFLCCRFCCSNKTKTKTKKEKKVSATPAGTAAAASSAQPTKSGATAVPPAVKKDNKGIVKNSPFLTKSQQAQ